MENKKNEEFKKFVYSKMFVKNGSQLNSRWTTNNGKLLKEQNLELYEYASSMKGCRTLAEALYLICNNLDEPPKCEFCNKNYKSFITFKKGYKNYCSTRCSSSDKKTQEKVKQTTLERYGVEHALQSEEIKNKLKETNLKKYGVEWASQAESSKEKARQTNLEKYGSYSPMQSEKVKNKLKRTNLERYGVACTLQIEEVMKKGREKFKRNYYDKFVLQLKEKNIELLSTKDEYIHNDVFKFKCLKCNEEFESSGASSFFITCKCRKMISNKEREIYNWLNELNINVVESDRKQIAPLELDIYLPDNNLAIEFNGLYWHSENLGIPKKYHLNKRLCFKRGFIKNLIKSI